MEWQADTDFAPRPTLCKLKFAKPRSMRYSRPHNGRYLLKICLPQSKCRMQSCREIRKIKYESLEGKKIWQVFVLTTLKCEYTIPPFGKIFRISNLRHQLRNTRLRKELESVNPSIEPHENFAEVIRLRVQQWNNINETIRNMEISEIIDVIYA